MTVLLTLLAHGPTAATRQAAFPADEPLLQPPPDPVAGLPWRGRSLQTSPARACRQIAAALPVAAATEPALADLDHGRWSGRALAEIAAETPGALAQWIADPAFRGHGGESRTDLAQRTGAWLDRCAKADRHVLALTHASVIRALILQALEAPDAGFWALDIAPATLTELRHDGRRWALRSMGVSIG